LRAQLATLERSWQQAHGAGTAGVKAPVPFGVATIDTALDGGLMPGALHEAYVSGTADMAALGGFATGLLHCVHSALHRPVVWVRQTVTEAETGLLYAPGLQGLGLDPENLIVVRTRTMPQLLGAGLEAVSCNAVSAVVIEAWDPEGGLDLTASRRLALASEKSGTMAFILRICPHPPPSAAITRWHISACPSQGFAANAPGYPAFDITLQRNRNGPAGQRWRVEWNHDDRHFQQPKNVQQTEPLSGSGVPLPQHGPAALGEGVHTPQHIKHPRKIA
jgi:protein ImuA